ncbi:MAG: hypothetical protein IIB82_07260 [Bacteroidetes bacterium]|nr:hypothetical protein [Bacteroidota bacterium]
MAEGLNGLSEYVETHAVTTNQFGLFTIVIGQGEHTGSLQDVDWQTGNKWLQIEMDMRGGSNFEMVGTQQIFSVPYAMYASQSGTGMTAGDGIDVTGGVISNTKPDKPVSLLGAGTVNVSGTYPDYVITGIEGQQTLSEVLMQDNDAGNMRIRNLAEPVSNQDVATKSYVDSRNVDDADADPTNEIQNAAQVAVTPTGNLTSTQVQLALEELQADIDADLDANPANEIQNLSDVLGQGSDAGGAIINNLADPIVATDAATKNYVDAQDALDLDKDVTNEIQTLSDVLTQGSDAGGSSINNLADPILVQDAATKSYVDAQDTGLANSITTNSTAISTESTNRANADAAIQSELDATEAGAGLNTNGTYTPDGTTTYLTTATDLKQADKLLDQQIAINTSDIATNTTDIVTLTTAINTTYAFKVPISATTSTDLTFDLSLFIFDENGIISGSSINITEPGIYTFIIKGTSSLATPSDMYIVISSVNYLVAIDNFSYYSDVFLFKLNVGDVVELKIVSVGSIETFNLEFFGYKI